jgi:DNA-binding transcriptional regulator YdaS (Cro superfamily)
MSDVLSKQKCPACEGTGHTYDRKHLNRLVKGLGDDQKSIAQKLGIHPSYLTRLIHGKRRWSPELVHKVQELSKAA